MNLFEPHQFHPVSTGDLPQDVIYRGVESLIPLSERTVRNHWQTTYKSWIYRNQTTGALMVNVIQCDQWLDQNCKPLLSVQLLQRKKKLNPGWIPICERIDANKIRIALTAGEKSS